MEWIKRFHPQGNLNMLSKCMCSLQLIPVQYGQFDFLLWNNVGQTTMTAIIRIPNGWKKYVITDIFFIDFILCYFEISWLTCRRRRISWMCWVNQSIGSIKINAVWFVRTALFVSCIPAPPPSVGKGCWAKRLTDSEIQQSSKIDLHRMWI